MKKQPSNKIEEDDSNSSLQVLDILQDDIKFKTPKIHPIIIYPYSQSNDYRDLQELYLKFIKPIFEDTSKYAKPITVLNRQTYYNNSKYMFDTKSKKRFDDFIENTVKKYSTVLDAWCVDSCQMWLTGLGKAFDDKSTGEDVYWLIPGDFNYSSENGKEVLEKIRELPAAVLSSEQDLCVGEIDVPLNSSKQLIDTYGTYGLLYNWFPHEAQEIRKITDKPRTEFFAISHGFLREILRQRWYAYEQTIVILLHGILGKKRINKIKLGMISDLSQGRDSLSAAMQQVERTERVLKLVWRERNEKQDPQWHETFRKFDTQSEQVRGAALVILQNLLSIR